MASTALPQLDVLSPSFAADPHAHLRELHDGHELARSERGIELLSHAACREAYADRRLSIGLEERFAATGIDDGPAFDALVESVIKVEGPLHRRLRGVAAPDFTPRRIERLRELARRLVDAALDEARADGGIEFVEKIGSRLPSSVFRAMIGAPLTDAATVARLADDVLRIFLLDPAQRETVLDAFAELDELVRDLISRRRERPGEDITSMLLRAVAPGELDEDEIVRMIVALLAASTDTTTSQLSLDVLALTAHQDQWELLRREPEHVPAAALELARFAPGVWSTSRYARAGTRLRDREIAPGTVLWVDVISGNRDPAVYDDPDRFDVTRNAPPPLSWGMGRHFCLGRSLALMEMQETLRSMLAHWRSFSLASTPRLVGVPYVVAPAVVEAPSMRRRSQLNDVTVTPRNGVLKCRGMPLQSPNSGGLVTLGESLILLTTREVGRLRHATELELRVGGAESNVAIGVRRLGVPATWIGRVGDDELGELIARTLRAEDVRAVAIRDRTASTSLMVKERPSGTAARVSYYRATGPGSRLRPDDLDPELIARAGVLHVSGITPALSASAEATVRAAIAIAHQAAVPVSFDVNLRTGLWSLDRASATLGDLCMLADHVFVGTDEALGLGWPGETPEEIGLAIRARSQRDPVVVVKSGADGAFVVTRDSRFPVAPVPVESVDPVGAGDAFAAGYLAELLAGATLEERLRTAAACGSAACTMRGDWEALPTRADLERLDTPDAVIR